MNDNEKIVVPNERKTMTNTSRSHLTRRRFLKTAGAASAAAMAPAVIPSSVLGRGGTVAPSERINLGGIGIHNRGGYVLSTMLPLPDVRFVAIADVRASQAAAVKATADRHNGDDKCDTYRDFRELLDRDDIDAVLITTGDHWHAHASMLAAEAGKDVYSEKPCAISIELAGRLADTIRRTGRVFQAGTQRRSISNFIHAIQERQGLQVACLEEIAFRQGYLSREQLAQIGHEMKNNRYGQYLVSLAEEGSRPT